MAEERLQKIIAQAGVASRRAAEALITEGRVKVNGRVVSTLGAKADPQKDQIEVLGHGVLEREPVVFVALHKPVNVVSTVRDPEGRPTVIDLLHESRAKGARKHEGSLPRVFPIGRLDFDAEGLILLTNDGETSNRLMHPRHHVPKTYLAKVKGKPEEKQLERLRAGVRLPGEDGKPKGPKTKPAEVRIFKQGQANAWLELTITEGRNHQVKRMCQAVGLWVTRLIRTEFAGITIDPLPPGGWRFLENAEIHKLRSWS